MEMFSKEMTSNGTDFPNFFYRESKPTFSMLSALNGPKTAVTSARVVVLMVIMLGIGGQALLYWDGSGYGGGWNSVQAATTSGHHLHHHSMDSNANESSLNHVCVLIPLKRELILDAISSVEKTRDSRFNYSMFLGIDDDDASLGAAIEQSPYIRGMHTKTTLVRVPNPLHKPGPVMNGLSKAGLEAGCDYLYRVNDDTEWSDANWTSRIVDTMRAFSPPNVGVVGPTCNEGNEMILTHDFVHAKNHHTIFGSHYPAALTDWWLDDWITKVYGPARTKKLPDVEVRHNLRATRYEVNHTNRNLLDGLVLEGSRLVEDFLQSDTAALRPSVVQNFSAAFKNV